MDPIQDYNADMYSAVVDRYTGPPFMEVEIVPPLRNNNINGYVASYDSRDNRIAQITGFEYYPDLQSCSVAANAIFPLIAQKYGLNPEANEFASGTTYVYGFYFSGPTFVASVACVVQSGYDTSLIVDLRTYEYAEAMNSVGNQF